MFYDDLEALEAEQLEYERDELGLSVPSTPEESSDDE
jgi:hypothetical protein